MRKDIEIHINTGDIALVDSNKPALRPFQWIDKPSGYTEDCLYGEVTLPSRLSADSIVSEGIFVSIPYTPKYKEVRLRFKQEHDGLETYIKNSSGDAEWFPLQLSLDGNKPRNLFASELISISEDYFYIEFNGDNVNLYSGRINDFNIVNANNQNKNLMLACVPSNNYRYPLMGVGLVRWVNSTIDVSKLASVLLKEFADDGTPVKNAEYNHEAKHLNLSLDTSTVDSDGKV